MAGQGIAADKSARKAMMSDDEIARTVGWWIAYFIGVDAR
jgi:hypothetical protein